MVVMSIGCSFIDKGLILEAIFECCFGHKQQKEIYDRFCDRLELRKVPFL